MICLFPRQTIQYHSNPSLCPTTKAEEAEQFYDGLQDLLELTPKKGVHFIIGDLNAKARSQEIPGTTGKFGLEVQKEAESWSIKLCVALWSWLYLKHMVLIINQRAEPKSQIDGSPL